MLPPFSGLATSAPLSQVNLGDVFATQTLNVDTVDVTSVATTATGNAFQASSDNFGIGVTLTQQQSNTINAKTTYNLTTGSPDSELGIMTAATSNTVEVDSSGGGGVFGTFDQVSDAAPAGACRPQEDGNPLGCVKADNDFNAGGAQLADASVAAQAIVNSVTVNATGGDSDFAVTQANSATVDSESGSDSLSGSADVGYASGQLVFTSVAVANNLAFNGNGAASATIDASQLASGDFITAGQFSSSGDAQTIVGESAASANIINLASSDGANLNVTATQDNETGFIESNSVVSAFEFGTGQSTAMGVGNSFTAENDGPNTDIALSQISGGTGMEASATFTGGNSDPTQPSYDASASSSAVANQAQVTNYGGGTMSLSGSQTNLGGVGAVTNVTVTGATRSVTSTANAIGNSMTFTAQRGG